MIQTADTLRYLYMGGRIGRAKHLVGSFLNIKPLISMEDGVITTLGVARTRQGAYHRMAALVEKAVGQGGRIRLALTHAARPGRCPDARPYGGADGHSHRDALLRPQPRPGGAFRTRHRWSLLHARSILTCSPERCTSRCHAISWTLAIRSRGHVTLQWPENSPYLINARQATSCQCGSRPIDGLSP